jgi:hypothetical protein
MGKTGGGNFCRQDFEVQKTKRRLQQLFFISPKRLDKLEGEYFETHSPLK